MISSALPDHKQVLYTIAGMGPVSHGKDGDDNNDDDDGDQARHSFRRGALSSVFRLISHQVRLLESFPPFFLGPTLWFLLVRRFQRGRFLGNERNDYCLSSIVGRVRFMSSDTRHTAHYFISARLRSSRTPSFTADFLRRLPKEEMNVLRSAEAIERSLWLW